MLAAARSLETAAESADRFHLVLSSVVPVAEQLGLRFSA